MIQKAELLERLAEGHAAGITVVTPNTRLAQALVLEFDSYQIGKDKTSWEAADILPFDAFVQRLYEDALYSDIETPLPMLLTPAQEESLWREALDRADLLAPAETAARCREAWRLMHAWRIKPARTNEDTAAFLAWASTYEKRSVSDTDSARLPDLVMRHLEHLKKPKLLVAYAFDILPPQAREFFQAFPEITHCHPERVQSSASRTSYPSAKEELEKAAQWARAQLENRSQAPISPRIGVVVPELERWRKEVVRVFSRVMRPGYNLPGAPKAAMPFNVSLGLSLDRYPVVALALSVLKFSREELPFQEVSELIRSPFLAGAEKELAARAKADVRLRRKLEATVTLPKLIGLLDRSVLRDRLEKLFALRDDGLFADKTPSEWARHFSTLLDTVGFPGERALDSEEFQARKKWNEVLGELARLDRVSKPFGFARAISLVKRICADTVFQPESPDAPIQVLGVLESAGMAFDCLWVSGLTDEAWPLRARPNPFLPVAAQRAAGIPEASAEGSLALDRRITEGWLGAAKEVVFSSFDAEEDRKLEPSPLIAGVEKKAVEIPSFPDLRNLIFQKKNLASLQDSKAPSLENPSVRGGTRILADQSACPFRAFAHYRLRAEALETPPEGLDASDRGRLLHALMASLWTSLKNSSSLEGDVAPAIDAAAAAAVKELGLEGRFAELERARLVRLAREWLEVERRRAPFEVVSIEQKRPIKIGPLEIDGRIDRLDKVKEGHVLVDYKTSRNVSANQWKVPRPDDPQLPIYAVTAKEDIAAVAFARVRPGEMRYMGFSARKDLIPQVQQSKNWSDQLRGWREEVEALAGAFAAGEARVDPKKELQTCRYCDLQTLCRVYEKVNPLKEDEGMEGTGE